MVPGRLLHGSRRYLGKEATMLYFSSVAHFIALPTVLWDAGGITHAAIFSVIAAGIMAFPMNFHLPCKNLPEKALVLFNIFSFAFFCKHLLGTADGILLDSILIFYFLIPVHVFHESIFTFFQNRGGNPDSSLSDTAVFLLFYSVFAAIFMVS
jgi:hypothetical protein